MTTTSSIEEQIAAEIAYPVIRSPDDVLDIAVRLFGAFRGNPDDRFDCTVSIVGRGSVTFGSPAEADAFELFCSRRNGHQFLWGGCIQPGCHVASRRRQ
jgi:hypothetical protein